MPELLERRPTNKAKAYGLYLGLILTHQKGIKKMKILGNSLLVIKHMSSNASAQNKKLNEILKRALGMLPLFGNFQLFHILRGLNMDVDMQVSMGF